MNKYSSLSHTHDLTLPDWGPYAYDLSGLSHIADLKKGLRMDFFFIPAIYRRIAFVPETLRECGCTPWNASGDFSFWSYRQTMIPGAFKEKEDLMYAETSFSKINDDFRLARIEFVNHTDDMRQVSLYGYARLGDQPAYEPKLPQGAEWVSSLSYKQIHYTSPRFDEHLVTCNGRRGEMPHPQAVGGRCVGHPYYNTPLKSFGAEAGDSIAWNIDCKGQLALRILIPKDKQQKITLATQHSQQQLTFTGTGTFTLVPLPIHEQGPITLTITSNSDGEGFFLDGLVNAPANTDLSQVQFLPISRSVHPYSKPDNAHSALLGADGFDTKYIFWWDRDEACCRAYSVDDVRKLQNYSYAVKHPLYRAVDISYSCPGNEFCFESYLTPLNVPAQGSLVIHFLIGSNPDEVQLQQAFNAIDRSAEALEAIYSKARQNAFSFANPLATPCQNFGQQILAASVMTNCLFPIACGQQWIRHHSPDKYYHTLYTWDSGFIGLGLLELDIRRAIENLNAYVTSEGENNAFVELGTPLPVQAYLYEEIWNRTQDLDMLEFYYPRLWRYYDFIAGHTEHSNFDRFQTHILRSFDYFYNSGGWDDYPAQWHLYRNGNSKNTAPVVTTAHALRFAKILLHASKLLLENQRLSQQEAEKAQNTLQNDISNLTNALQNYSWNEKDGIFSYVIHNDDGTFQKHWRYQNTDVNINFGLDGVSPLVSDICTDKQRDILWNLLKTPGRLWTPMGITAVDMTQPYFKTNGYWNGSVWMPHQWFIWKAALDAGDAAFARKIAKTAVKILSNEVAESRGTYEHYSAVTGKGGGCFHFGGLTSIVLNFYSAYYTPGRLTTGLGGWVKSQKAEADGGLTAVLDNTSTQTSTLLYATGKKSEGWKVTLNGTPANFTACDDGSLEIQIPPQTANILLKITR